MKNQSLKNVVKEHGKNPNLIVSKTDVCGVAISIHIDEPSFVDVGTYPYYARKNDRDADFEELQTSLKEALNG